MDIRFRRSAAVLTVGSALILAIVSAVAQQAAQPGQTRGGRAGDGRAGAPPAGRAAIAPPPINWDTPPLPDGPIMLQSAEPAHRNLRIVVVTC